MPGATDIIFGAFIPQGWKNELASIPGAVDQWNTAVSIAVRAEELRYDSVWVYDHFHNTPRPNHESVFECWATLAAISQRTSTVRLGQMVGCNSYRNPAVLAKITSTIDVISGGRLEWGIGAGWYENEYRAYGVEFPAPRDRIKMLDEAVQIVRSMWTQPETTFHGEHYQVRRAQCDPKPLQQPCPPVWIGGGGEQLTLRTVAKYADRSNFGGAPDAWAHKRDVLRDHCRAVGRDADEITMTWSPDLLVRETEAEIDAVIEAGGAALTGGKRVDEWRGNHLVGTVAQVADQVAAYVALGCGGFVPWCCDYPDTQSLELFATHILPEYRS